MDPLNTTVTGQWKSSNVQTAQNVDFCFQFSPTHLDSVRVHNVPSQIPWKAEAQEGSMADWNLP